MLPRFFILSLLTQLSWCITANRTIDDTLGDPITGSIPVYAPAGNWSTEDCSDCVPYSDISQSFEGTWHQTTHHAGDAPSSVTLQFTGTAVYLFSIIPNPLFGVTTAYNLQFILDGVPVGSFTHQPNFNATTFQYSVPVLSLENLVNEPHTLVAEPGGSSFFIFDYAIYTSENGSTPTGVSAQPSFSTDIGSTQTSTVQTTQTASTVGVIAGTSASPRVPAGVIAGCAVSAPAIILLVAAIIICATRRRRRRRLDVVDEDRAYEAHGFATVGDILTWTRQPEVPNDTMSSLPPNDTMSSPPAAPPSYTMSSESPPVAPPHYTMESKLRLEADFA
ncbi:hypothetical protein GGX14DRAFT_618076 [Mycena pura]|uniref:Uncharacterized protein n=1 Tax=Mycena pura TaxID=153505 RepID=A0AAD6VIK5_9AGAR|nr:hypothetical protein GGX14DRAFT_618076 [Mycena pura]